MMNNAAPMSANCEPTSAHQLINRGAKLRFLVRGAEKET
jgi:hypothetical protein